jgi:probable HAF family extracellular repeat protein
MNVRSGLLALVVVLCVAGAHDATAVPLYRVTDLGSGIFPNAINASGQITGVTTTGDGRAFLYSGGIIHDLGTLGGNSSAGLAINDDGVITGGARTSTGVLHVFRYAGGAMQDLGGGSFGQGLGINNSGQITGQATSADGALGAFVYSGGALQFIGQRVAWGSDINAGGQVTGFALRPAAGSADESGYAFLYSGGSIQDLGTLGGLNSRGEAINDRGDVTGLAQTADGSGHVFLYSGGSMHDLGEGVGEGINNDGWIVGDLGNGKPFLYDGTARHDLHDLLDGSGAGWTLGVAQDINDAGQIIGHGIHNGAERAYLLTPVPEPATYALMLCGLGLLALGRRGRRLSPCGGHPSPCATDICLRQ